MFEDSNWDKISDTKSGVDYLKDLYEYGKKVQCPEHIEDVLYWVQDAINSRELKNEIFRYKMNMKLKF